MYPLVKGRSQNSKGLPSRDEKMKYKHTLRTNFKMSYRHGMAVWAKLLTVSQTGY